MGRLARRTYDCATTRSDVRWAPASARMPRLLRAWAMSPMHSGSDGKETPMNIRAPGLALRVLLTFALAALLTVSTAVTGLATTGVDSTSTTLARGQDLSTGNLVLRWGTDTVVAQNVFAPGGSSGWHSHPGGAVVVIASGQLTLYRSVGGHCVSTTYSAGQSFLERPRDVQNGVNTGSIETVAIVTFPSVPHGGSPRIDVPDPGTCPGA
jgi:quercetin dioxygenase-like cupin family protein